MSVLSVKFVMMCSHEDLLQSLVKRPLTVTYRVSYLPLYTIFTFSPLHKYRNTKAKKLVFAVRWKTFEGDVPWIDLLDNMEPKTCHVKPHSSLVIFILWSHTQTSLLHNKNKVLGLAVSILLEGTVFYACVFWWISFWGVSLQGENVPLALLLLKDRNLLTEFSRPSPGLNGTAYTGQSVA